MTQGMSPTILSPHSFLQASLSPSCGVHLHDLVFEEAQTAPLRLSHWGGPDERRSAMESHPPLSVGSRWQLQAVRQGETQRLLGWAPPELWGCLPSGSDLGQLSSEQWQAKTCSQLSQSCRDRDTRRIRTGHYTSRNCTYIQQWQSSWRVTTEPSWCAHEHWPAQHITTYVQQWGRHGLWQYCISCSLFLPKANKVEHSIFFLST